MIGDFNLPGIQWENGTNFNDKVTDPIKTSFVNSFAENYLEQCINEPTHRAGNVLDLLLTTSSNSISNLKINDTPLCKSDHFSINFEVDLKVKRRKSIKRKCFNFKKANWDNLNNELAKINWCNLLDSIDPIDSWNTFVNLLHHYLNRNIPTLTTKGKFNPPWFDSECHSKCREKERLHKKFVSTKFWGYVKSTSNTHRIPEVMCLDTKVSSDAETKANLFNQYFFHQFSEASNYEIDINFSNDSDFDINYSPERIEKLLKDVNINKAGGPDGIPGIVLKRCSGVLAEPLSIIFKVIYNTGIVPSEWKLSNVVPIFKKGDKKDIKNYRLNDNILDYTDNECDLGVIVNTSYSWNDKHDKILRKASQILGLTKRTCHFINDRCRRKCLYLALIRSQFEHCSQIWRPIVDSQVSKFEQLQKSA